MPECYLSQQKTSQFTQLFTHFDYYKTGTIHYTSLVEILKSMSIQMQISQVYDLLRDVGNSNMTMIKLDQFLAIFSVIVEDRDFAREIEIVFKVFDADKNRVIDKEDIRKAMDQLNLAYNEEEIVNMLKIAKKKQLTLGEFEDYLLKNF